MKKSNLMIAAGIIVTIGVFYFFTMTSAQVKLVGNDEFSSLVNDDVFTLQVHPSYFGEIDGTDLIIEDWENIENYLDQLPSKETPIAVYCRSGSMSGIVAQELINLGYEVVYDLEGGMNSWEEGGNELVVLE